MSDPDKFSFVSLGKPTLGQTELAYIRDCFNSGWVAKGPMANKFEGEVENLLDVKHAIAVTNCTSALHLALMALGVQDDDRVVIPDYTFPATGFAVRYVRADPYLCDIEADTYNMSADKLEQILKWHPYKIKAIIVVHAFGQVAEMDQIMRIARKYEMPVIEDAACALGAKYQGKHAGTWGDIGCFSLHGRKGITTGEGGLVVTDNEHYATQMRRLSEFGVQSTFDREQSYFSIPSFDQIGYNYKMSDIAAAVGRAQLQKLDNLIASRREIAHEYTKFIRENDLCFEPPYEDSEGEHIYQAYVALVKPEYKKYRNRLIDMFFQWGVQTTIGTYALHRQPYFAKEGTFAKSNDIFDRAIAFPIWKGVNAKRVMKVMEEVCRELKNLSTKRQAGSIIQKSNGGCSEEEDHQELSL